MKKSNSIQTKFTQMLGIDYPIIAAPMFLVSNMDIVVSASEAGGIGAFPALNYRPIENYRKALFEMKQKTKKPIGVNIIAHRGNPRQKDDLKHALDAGVEFFITSLGSPKEVIDEAHKIGSKVFCDVTNLEHALKVQDWGADGVIAVGSGAGGHAGPITPFVLIPWLKQKLSIPIVAAGGISHGSGIAAALALGADAVSVGTRFIASQEAQVDDAYKRAIVDSTPEDIVLTTRVSGTPLAVINTDYIKKTGTDLPIWASYLKKNPYTKKYVAPAIFWLGTKMVEEAALKPTYKTVWSAGQSVGLVDEIAPTQKIIENLVSEYFAAVKGLP